MTEPRDETNGKLDARVVRTRATVLAAGRELMTERGVRGIVVEEITKRTGVAKTTIYRHWPTREDLVLAVIAETGYELPAPHTSDPVRDIRTILMATWKAMADPSRRSGLASMIDLTATNPTLATLHRELIEARGIPLADAVRRAIDAGAVPDGLDPELLTELLGAPVVLRAFIRADPPDRRFVDRLIQQVLGAPSRTRSRGC